jgi:6-aminohexanoate-oligomer endohydrolase
MTSQPTPRIPKGDRVLEFDFPALEVGVAEYEEGPTGCTVFHFPRGAVFAADVRGGSPGTVNADVGFARAVCFAGGSLMGLEAAAGVAAELFDRRGHEHVEWSDVPLVAGAIVFDFGRRTNGVYPDKELGRAALRAARPGWFPLGRRGAGRLTSVGKSIAIDMSEPGGQGAAFTQVGSVKVASFCVVNAIGAIHDRSGKVVRGNRQPDGSRRPFIDLVAAAEGARPGNTTLTVVVTNLRLPGRVLGQTAKQVHASMARAIQPFHTENDGDVLFFVSTNEVDDRGLTLPGVLGAVASEVVWDAVLASFDP